MLYCIKKIDNFDIFDHFETSFNNNGGKSQLILSTKYKQYNHTMF